MAFWGASGSAWPRGWEGSFCPWVSSFLVSGLWEPAPRVLPGDARWGSWGESRAQGVLGPPQKTIHPHHSRAGPWPHAATGRLMAHEASPSQKAAPCQIAAPSPSGPKFSVQALESSESEMQLPRPKPSPSDPGSWGGRGARRRCCEPPSCGFQFSTCAPGVSVRTPLQGQPRVTAVGSETSPASGLGCGCL